MSIGEADFRQAMHRLYWCYEYNGLGNREVWGVGWGRRRVRQLFGTAYLKDMISLMDLLTFTGNKCCDPRDRIYSLLGMASERDRVIAGSPDYSKKNTVEAAYTNFVINFIEVKGSLDICFGFLFKPLHTSGDTWPSWLPDWRIEIHPRIVPLMVSQPG